MQTLIVTFYAYKGGTGRTLALANVARYLAEELGYRVGLVDLDLESPGLVHEPLCALLDPDNMQREVLLNAMDRQRGFIQCFLDSFEREHTNDEKVDRYVYALANGTSGAIVLMPSGLGSVRKSQTYEDALRQFMVKVSPETADVGSPSSELERLNKVSEATWSILRRFADGHDLDFLIMDGRTGSGPLFSPAYTYSVPHLLVLFSGMNEQNIFGSIATLQTADKAAAAEVPVVLVVSPVPTVGPDELEQRLEFVATELAKARKMRKPSARYRYKLPLRVNHYLPYSDAAAFGEAYFPGRFPHSPLAVAHRKLASAIAELVIRPTSARLENAQNQSLASVTTEPIIVAFERVHEDVIARWDPKLNTRVYISEDPESPWEALRSGEAKNLKALRDNLPDVLAIPQTHLQHMVTKHGRELFHDLIELRETQRTRHIRALDFEFLDTYYANWRRWCSTEFGPVGLPFSVNARLLCADASQLRGTCEQYWMDRQQRPPDAFFLPSSWHALSELIRAGLSIGNKRDSLFRIVAGDRGLYYDWLTYVCTMGGFDIIQAEGRLTQEVALTRPETISATRQFLELASLCGTSKTMEEHNDALASGQLAMFVSWTDSFRFLHQDGRVSGISVIRSSTDRSSVPPDIRLGHTPRDMRYPQNTLVDGWVMVFPRKGEESLRRALTFADRFFNPDDQRQLLRQGFPSPSAWAVERELEALHTERNRVRNKGRQYSATVRQMERSFDVFLQTMRLATKSGKWIASPGGTMEIESQIGPAVRSLLSSGAAIEETFGAIAKGVWQACEINRGHRVAEAER